MSQSTERLSDLEVFSKIHPTSKELFQRASRVLAGQNTHDLWQLDPHPIVHKRAEGPYKWDVDNRRYIDFWMGHGGLLMGHGYAPVVEAIREQALLATHYGGIHPLMIEWAEQVCRLIPSAERVRFTASGTEATLLAMRVARAYTGRGLMMKLDGHFHGWHDEALCCHMPAKDSGLNPSTEESMLVANSLNPEQALELLDTYAVAGVILEPGGGSSGGLPWSEPFLKALRESTKNNGTLLIFDEVISGFRNTPGGIQGRTGILPDLTTLGKILSAGMPAGAVAGKAEIMSVFGEGITREDGSKARAPHTGTSNANPISAAAGVALLSRLGDGEVQRQAEKQTRLLVEGVNREADRSGVDARMFAQDSTFHLMIGALSNGYVVGPSPQMVQLYARYNPHYKSLRRALLNEGLDSNPIHGWLSPVHSDEVIEAAVAAFGRAFDRMKGYQEFPLA